jgi:hypothetical protein
VLERRGREPLGLIDDEQLGQIGRGSRTDELLAVQVLVDADARTRDKLGNAVAHLAERAADCGRVEDGPGAGDRCVDLGIGGLARSPVDEQGLGNIPLRIAPRRQGLADTGRAKAEADVAVLAHGIGELGKAPVFLRRDEGARPLAARHGSSSS